MVSQVSVAILKFIRCLMGSQCRLNRCKPTLMTSNDHQRSLDVARDHMAR